MKNPQQNHPPLKITRFDSCDSTNSLLLTAAEAGAPAGSVYVAREQLAGRGRRGREWLASPGDSLTFSLLWTFEPDPAKLTGLPLLVGLSVVRALTTLSVGQWRCVQLGLKWPNDLLLARQDGTFAKVGGVLVESALRSGPDEVKELAVVIGIGLNCGDSAAIKHKVLDQQVGSLAELWLDHVPSERILDVVLDQLRVDLSVFGKQGFAPFYEAWNDADLWQKRCVKICEQADVLYEGVSRGVDADGALCIETESGIKRIISGDVSLRKV
jgi:BirA family biotin operon repressor/biotin-[acetyl-CoA-carboxylase] ligase